VTGRTKAVVAAGVAVLFAIPGVPWLLGIRKVPADAEPFDVAEAFPYHEWEAILGRFVGRDGAVDYPALAADDGDLRRFVATLAVAGPTTRPDLFPTEVDAFAWHINAYNAVTLLGIVAHWPNAGVHDISGPLNPKDGFGFFYGLRFLLDGRWTNTYDLENTAMRPVFKDARLHAAINCASASCPRLSRNAYVPDRLDEQLQRAAAEFASIRPHVAFDEDARVVRLSRIFEWFPGDFEGGVLPWIKAHARPSIQVLASRAVVEKWPIEYVDYDWSLNRKQEP